MSLSRQVTQLALSTVPDGCSHLNIDAALSRAAEVKAAEEIKERNPALHSQRANRAGSKVIRLQRVMTER